MVRPFHHDLLNFCVSICKRHLPPCRTVVLGGSLGGSDLSGLVVLLESITGRHSRVHTGIF